MSAEADVVDEVMSRPIQDRLALIRGMPDRAMRRRFRSIVTRVRGTPYAIYFDAPAEFAEDVLGAELWSTQRQILESVRDHGRTAVPACHGPGKSFTGSALVAWWIACFTDFREPGQAIAITSAPRARQVRAILWPEIRARHRAGELPGDVLTTKWKVLREDVAWGFSAQDNDETAFSGLHRDHVLIVIDEGGGISDEMGQSITDALTGFHTRALVIGNPPIDRVGSWFESICQGSASIEWNTIPIPFESTPNHTGEEVSEALSRRLVDERWLESVRREFGEAHPYWVARVEAKFPKIVANVCLPVSWIEEAQDAVENVEQRDHWDLGVDIASDGGDELAIGRLDPDGDLSLIHTAAGDVLQNSVDVAGIVLEKIQETEKLAADHAARHGLDAPLPVRVKVDSIGLGWGPVSTLQAWGSEGRHGAQVIGVNVSEKAREPVERGDPGFKNQRAEMHWNLRQLIDPDGGAGPRVHLSINYQGQAMKLVAQLSAATYRHDSAGRIQIESKESIKEKRKTSPDRAECLMLAAYLPPAKGTKVEILS